MAKIKKNRKKFRVVKKIAKFLKIKIKPWLAPSGIILIFFLIIGAWFYPLSKTQNLTQQLLNDPQNLKKQLELIEILLENNQFNEAEKILLLATEKQNNDQIKSLWQKKYLNNPQDIEKIIDFWEKIIIEKPNYRDAYLQLAILNYRIWQNEEAKKYLEKALITDPNFEPALKLKKLFEKQDSPT